MVRLEGKLCVFPGIPRLFQRMLNGLTPYLPLPPPSERPCRQQVFTPYVYPRSVLELLVSIFPLTAASYRLPESSIAPYLTTLQSRTKHLGIRIGSYPLLQHGVYVSFIGQDREHVKELAEETARELQGRLVSDEEAREMVRAKERGAA